ncbi:MAG: alanine--tRNA ligase [Chitinophagales bacterium]
MRSAEIRKAFLDFFESKGHKIVPSAPIVVKNDPTLMFINSGMAPFKDIFLGNQPIKYARVADTQKCLRVSGKHNDLEEVGVDTYHHTMFEMLGNWSFGDYFKKEAIEWSWELLTKVYGLEKDRLYVTVFEGDAKENLAFDQDSYNEWKKWISEERILKGNKKDNFWEMGDTGPCGPCSEIHIDLRSEEDRKKLDGKELVNASHPQVIEVWNNVFMEFERKADKSLVKLPKQHVDTGMGFERLCVAIQKKTSNYDTDVFQPIIQQIAALTNKQYGKDEKTDIAMRVVADHIRAITFTIADGQMLSNTGAGYVIRRILRRAVRYYYTYLESDTPLLYKLVEVLCNEMGSFFPEIVKQKEFIETVIKEEENSFLKTLSNGIRRFAAIEEEMGKTKSTTVAGPVAFELFDTYGFPLDLTRLMASEKGYAIDEAGFEKEMAAQKDRARAAQATEQGDWVNVEADTKTDFVGYDYDEAEAQVVKYRSVKQKDKELYQVVLDKTPFYAESGGQIGDTGLLDFGGEKIEVLDTKKENDLIVHWVKKLPTKPEGKVHAQINERRRNDIRKNHSATHLLQSALRTVLGNHVQQKGSLVHPDYLRFDFAHFAKLSEEEIAKVEQIVNDKIMENVALDEKRNVPIKDAEKLGATMLFGEKYGEFVRVITFDEKFSRELCGGTHVRSTGEIGLFKIISESSISAGVRRIEAVTGRKALEYVDAKVNELKEITELFKGAKNVVQSLKSLQEQSAQLQKENEQLQDKLVGGLIKEYAEKVEAKGNVKLLTAKVGEVNSADALRKLGIGLVNEAKEGYVFLLSTTANGKQVVHLRVAPSLGIKAGDLLKELSATIKGGGPADFVQASAGSVNEVDELSAKLKAKFSN